MKEILMLKISGEFITEQARSFAFEENMPVRGYWLLINGLSISTEEAEAVINGKKKLVGDNTMDLEDDDWPIPEGYEPFSFQEFMTKYTKIEDLDPMELIVQLAELVYHFDNGPGGLVRDADRIGAARALLNPTARRHLKAVSNKRYHDPHSISFMPRFYNGGPYPYWAPEKVPRHMKDFYDQLLDGDPSRVPRSTQPPTGVFKEVATSFTAEQDQQDEALAVQWNPSIMSRVASRDPEAVKIYMAYNRVMEKKPCPPPDFSLSSTNGWLTSEGVFYPCDWHGHGHLVWVMFQKREIKSVPSQTEEKTAQALGWIKITTNDRRSDLFKGEKNPTPKQCKTAMAWCEKHKIKWPDWLAPQKDE